MSDNEFRKCRQFSVQNRQKTEMKRMLQPSIFREKAYVEI